MQSRPTGNLRLSTSELLAYVASWAVTIACVRVDDANVVSTIFLFGLPGTLLFGPVGFALGGRRWIVPFSAIGTIIWWMVPIISTIGAVR